MKPRDVDLEYKFYLQVYPGSCSFASNSSPQTVSADDTPDLFS